MSASVSSQQRFTRSNPCPVFGGFHTLPQGQGTRCYGFLSSDGLYAHCTREDRAGYLTPHTDDTFVHRLQGDCNCGTQHSPAPIVAAPAPRRTIDRTWDYTDEAGNRLFQVVKYKPKGFSQRQSDGDGGWLPNMTGARLVPYRLPDIINANTDRVIFVGEGEKDADVLAALDLIATCNPMGDGKWRDEYSVYLIDRRVVILPDNDDAGRKHAEQVAASLHGIAASVRVLALPGLPEKGDVSDWLANGGTRKELRRLVDATPEWAPTKDAGEPVCSFTGFSAAALMDMDLPEPRHIVAGLFAEGSGILAGRPKIGKSWFALQLALSVARGDDLFDHATLGGDVLYLALEDNKRRLRSRISKAFGTGDVPARLWLHTEWERLDRGGLEALDEWLTNAELPRLVIIDTLAKVKPRRPRNADPYEHDHEVMSMLTTLAGKHGVLIILIHHTRKAVSDDFIDSVTGTLGLSGGTDATIVLARTRGQTDATLSITGRDVDEQELALEFDADTCLWRLMGDADEYRQTKARIDVLEVMRRNGQPMRPGQVAQALDKNRSTVRWLMTKMAGDGTLKAWGDGKYTIKDGVSSTEYQHPQQDTHPQLPQPTNTPSLLADGAVYDVGAVGPVGTSCSKDDRNAA